MPVFKKLINSIIDHYNDHIILKNAYYQNYRAPASSFLILLNKILITLRHIGI